jgi:Carboxypeptidase regulatory-like domain
MPEGEIQRLIANREGRLCARWYRRTDGTVLTADCPMGFRARVRRVSLVAGTALSAFMGVGTAKAQQKGDTSSPSASPSLVQIDDARQAKGMISVRVVDASGAVIPNAKISVVNPAGDIVAQGSTNFEGEFQVTGLSNSRYVVQAESFGFKRTQMKDITPSVNTIPVQLTVDMASTMGVVVTVDYEVPITHDETAVQDSLPLATVAAPPHKQNLFHRLFSRAPSSAK